jgi:hypothetical protein
VGDDLDERGLSGPDFLQSAEQRRT